jgi:DHA1 family tetracycline resistance protein-like MFS transporter
MAESAAPTPSRAAFIFVFITVVLDMLALGIIIPVLPKLIVEFEGGDIAKAAAVTGVFGAMWALMQFVASPILGSLSDRFGRRPVILLSNLGLGLDYLLMALAPSLTWLFIGRIFNGITSASYATASAYVADVTPPEKRAAKFGMLGAAFGLGFVIGPAVGGYLGSIDLRLPFWVAAGLGVLNFCYGFFVLPESLSPERRKPFMWKQASPMGAFKLMRSHRVRWGLATAAIMSFLAHESLPSVFVLYTDFRYGWDERMVGIMLALIGVASTIVSAAVIGPAVKKFGERNALAIGYASGAVSFFAYGLAPDTMWFLLGIPFGALWGLAGPSAQALASRYSQPNEQGQLQGAFAAMRGITGMIGPLLFTQTFALAIKPGREAATMPGAPYVLAGLLLTVGLVRAWYATQPAPSSASPSS